MKRVVIIQSSYIPWKGYFDLIHSADEFIIYDHVQFTKRDWRNRNQLKSKSGLRWITIPVRVKGRYTQPISEVEVVDNVWPDSHYQTIRSLYLHAPHFKNYQPWLEGLYRQCRSENNLSKINFLFISQICDLLSINTKISWSSSYTNIPGKTENLVNLCKQAGATEYISGPSAQNYIDQGLFEKESIKLTYADYSGYSEYRQLWPPFRHEVSILDLILNEGPDAAKFMKSFK